MTHQEFIEIAKEKVRNYEKEQGIKEPFEVLVIWSCQISRCGKAFLCSSLNYGGRVFEATLDWEHKAVYFDVYVNTDNMKILL